MMRTKAVTTGFRLIPVAACLLLTGLAVSGVVTVSTFRWSVGEAQGAAAARAASLDRSTSDRPVRIVMIGDSITQGGKGGRDEYTYRWPLFQMLVDGGYKFDFVGSQRAGLDESFKWPAQYQGVPFDPDHEGVYGIKTAAAMERLREVKDLWEATPDIALIHLGTNDQKADDLEAAVQAPLREMVGLLREVNPDMVIVIGHVNLDSGGAIRRMRALVNELAEKENTERSPIITVDHFEGWREDPEDAESDTYDWAHPNPRGQRKMASKWFEAIRPYLSHD